MSPKYPKPVFDASLLEEFSGAPFFLGTPFSDEDRAMIRSAASLVPGLAGLLGRHCEIIVHSLEDPARSTIAAANETLSHRTVGSPIQRQGLLVLKESAQGKAVPYFGKSERGQRLKAVIIPIVNAHGRCLGGVSLAVNLDAPINDFIRAFTPSSETPQEENRVFGASPTGIDAEVDSAVRRADALFGEKDKNRAKSVISELYEKGVFNYRGAVQTVSEKTGISPVTVYWHLRELKKAGKEMLP